MGPQDLRLADLLAALSVATDLGMGQQPEKAVRSCLLATEMARAMDLPHRDVHDVYYATLLQHLGCTAQSHDVTQLFGDDLAGAPQAERTDVRNAREALSLFATVGRGTGPRRLGHVARTVAAGSEGMRRILRGVCEVGARLAQRLGLGPGVQQALYHSLESWDGRDSVHRLTGDDIALPARFSAVATQAVIFDRFGGPDAALEMVRSRAGGWFDPAVAGAFMRVGPEVLRFLAEADVWVEVCTAEPQPQRRVPATHLDTVAAAFGDVADLKTPHTLGHSSEVAALAAAAAQRLDLDDNATQAVRRAGLLHDLGRVAVANAVWERPRALTTGQWEQVRLHPYQTERILARSAALESIAGIAGRHHERLDGSGYHRGAAGITIPVEARLLATADAFQAMTQERPHRPALAPDEAARRIEVEAESGRMDTECARAVVEAAGHQPLRAQGTWPAGLSDREVEVVRLVAQGLSNREVAEELEVSRRTAEHHVQHIYAKIGVSTRAAAAVFAMEHALLR